MTPRRNSSVLLADASKCSACHDCEQACALAHAGLDLHERPLSELILRPRLRLASAGGLAVPILCRHCANPPCAAACRKEAIVREQGLVRIIEKACVGCKLCVKACPFGAMTVKYEGPAAAVGATAGAPRKKPRGMARKCDLCADTDREVPACVEACPTRALRLVDVERHRRSQQTARAAQLVEARLGRQRAKP